MLGATVGGGVGVMTGLHGLALDALQSVRIVTAGGDLVTASATSNSGLFWAIRGAGANFGIITEATYEIYDQPNGGNAVFGSFTFPASANASVWEALQSFDDDMPPELAIHLSIIYSRTSNSPLVGASIVYFGTEDYAQPYLDRFQNLDHLTASVRTLAIPDVYNILSTGQCENGRRVNSYTVGLGKTDVGAFQEVFGRMAEFFQSHQDYTGVLVVQRYSNEKALEVTESETAHPWRDTKTYM